MILMGFLTTSLHKNSQNDVKLLETFWFWHILGKGTHIYSNQKHSDFHQKSPWTPKSQLSPVCATDSIFIWIFFCHETGADNWFHLIFIAFICTGDVDCNSHGFCNVNNGQCDCDSNWDTSPDCSSNVNIAGLSQKNANISMADWFDMFFFLFFI